ncbi:MAG TPA: DUF1800 domain-containing protein [Burkholderia sp.]|nr:DUF1800 domain-containing protein [Burkholderia sp.]
MDHPNDISPAAIALNRFGLGARADDAPPAEPRRALLAQFDRYEARPAAWAGEPDAVTLATRFANTRNAMTGDDAAARRATAQSIRRDGYAAYRSAVAARLNSALNTPAPFVERLVHFWANHFAVSVDKGQVAAYAGAFERDAIRPHVLGRFEDMLVAVEQHPAMQLFLDQARSVGPDSPAALRADARNPAARRGLNENLAREIMELHTLGVRSGYTQADVTSFAKVITGWSMYPPKRFPERGGEFWFNQRMHEPGAQTVLGRSFAQDGFAQGRAVLDMLAHHPATATHIATKLVKHFVADEPPAALVDRLAKRFRDSGGDLAQVTEALVTAPEAWAAPRTKLKKPGEWTVAAMRASGLQIRDVRRVINTQNMLGEPLWRPPAPKGFSDDSAAWVDGLAERLDVANQVGRLVGNAGAEPDAMIDAALGPLASPETRETVRRAESRPQALALLLMSPEFQRR